MTDEELKYFESTYVTDDDYAQQVIDRFVDEIKRLRTQNDKLRGWLDESRSVIEAYQTPNVDNIEVKDDHP